MQVKTSKLAENFLLCLLVVHVLRVFAAWNTEPWVSRQQSEARSGFAIHCTGRD